MIDPRALIIARRYGEVRYSTASDYSGNLSCVLGKFGLTPDKSLLVEHDRETALQILTHLLGKDMAYQSECIPQHVAESLAQQILKEHETSGSRYFSNGNSVNREGWFPLTEATFDAGLIIIDPGGQAHFCIWFEDED